MTNYDYCEEKEAGTASRPLNPRFLVHLEARLPFGFRKLKMQMQDMNRRWT